MLTETADWNEWVFLAACVAGLVLSVLNLRERLQDSQMLRTRPVNGPRRLFARASVENEVLRLLTQVALTITAVGFLFSPSVAVATISVWVMRIALIAVALSTATNSANNLRRHRQLRRLVATKGMSGKAP